MFFPFAAPEERKVDSGWVPDKEYPGYHVKRSPGVTFLPQRVYIGTSSGASDACDHDPEDADDLRGNSLLLDMSDGEVLFIGSKVVSFKVRVWHGLPVFSVVLYVMSMTRKSLVPDRLTQRRRSLSVSSLRWVQVTCRTQCW